MEPWMILLSPLSCFLCKVSVCVLCDPKTSFFHSFTVVSAKFVYDSDIDVTNSEYREFVQAICSSFEIIGRLLAELPFYKLYNNQLSQEFIKNQKVLKQAREILFLTFALPIIIIGD